MPQEPVKKQPGVHHLQPVVISSPQITVQPVNVVVGTTAPEYNSKYLHCGCIHVWQQSIVNAIFSIVFCLIALRLAIIGAKLGWIEFAVMTALTGLFCFGLYKEHVNCLWIYLIGNIVCGSVLIILKFIYGIEYVNSEQPALRSLGWELIVNGIIHAFIVVWFSYITYGLIIFFNDKKLDPSIRNPWPLVVQVEQVVEG